MLSDTWKTAFAVALSASTATAIILDIHNEQSVKNAAATAAYNTWSTYQGNQTGHIPGSYPQLWAQGGMLFDTSIQYWYYTGDTSNNAAIIQGMNWQSGNNDFFPSNYSAYLGNDDQQTWALAAMTAAELNFPQDSSKAPWITMVENVFNEQIKRWDTSSCGGGLRWQIWPYQAGYNLKNANSNAGLFELSARLAWYTNNQTYVDWAEKVWDWSAATLMNTSDWTVWDAAETVDNCQAHGDLQWTYNYGPFLRGAVYMYNQTNGNTSKWEAGLQGLLTTSLKEFFPERLGSRVLSQITCEPAGTCETYQIALKGAFAQDLATVALLAPQTSMKILPLLQESAVAAAKTCDNGNDRTRCGTKWYNDQPDGTTGTLQDLSATGLFTANLVAFEKQNPGTQAHGVNQTAAGSTTTAANGTSASSSTGSAAATTTGTNSASRIAGDLFVVVAVVIAGLMAVV